MSESHGLKMATATKADVKNLYTLYHVLENLKKYDAQSIDDFEHFEEDEKKWISRIFVDGELDADELVKYLYGLISGFHRVVMGFEVLFDNCADPNCSHLEFNTDIKEAFALWNQLETDLKEGKTVSISPDSAIGKEILEKAGKEATDA